MPKITLPVSALPKIGPKYKKLLENLEIFTVEDLIYHFPFRYDDYSEISKIEDLQVGQEVTIKGILSPIQNTVTRNRKRISKAEIMDQTGKMEIVWFNQFYLQKSLQMGEIYYVSGKVGEFSKKKCFIAPEIEIAQEGKQSLNTGRLVPIYPETYGISSKWLRTRINDVLNTESFNSEVTEFLPREILEKQNYFEIKKAFSQIHFPDSTYLADNSRERFAFEEMFIELLNIMERKNQWSKELQGIKMTSDPKTIEKLIKSLPFKLTTSQQQSVEEIISDFEKDRPMNRLLEGDVGTGKTIVALIASFITQKNGYKTLYMAPTEILANQHFETFTRILPDLKIILFTGQTSKKLTKEELDQADIIIGTHAILFKEQYSKIGLVVIDEQHRFGVEQRGKILKLGEKGKTPHLLTMTATPIPRTLALTIYGDLAISQLKTHPNTKRQITTKVVPENKRDQAYKWIRDKNEPTFIVCPFIEESDSLQLQNVKAAEEEFIRLKNGVFKDVSTGLLHGRMKSKEKDEIVEQFRKGKVKVLVSTPVIEVGIDIPDATIIVIESAERYGLASLHQLRGRVGRGDKPGFCFTFMTGNSKTAYARLKNLENVDNGLELAEIDMKYRGQGDIFGQMQHGFKRFKIANPMNLEFMTMVKEFAQEYYPKLSDYPLLKARLTERRGTYISNN